MSKELSVKLHLLSEEPPPPGFISTGSYALNKVISGDYNGGVPRASITEFCGESSTAKTIFLISTCVQAQKLDYHVKFQDVERSLHAEFAKKQGLDPKKLYISYPETVEDIFEDIEGTINTIRKKDLTTPILIACDSLAVAPIRKELDSLDYEQSETLGMIRAKIIGGALRKLNPLLRKHDVTLLLINQFRSKMAMYGSPDTKAAGGRSLQFYCAVCLSTKSTKKNVLEDELGNARGITGTLVNTKNKVAIPFRECDFELIFDRGLTPDYGLVDMLCKDGLIDDKTTQGWCQVGDKKFRRKDFLDKFRQGDFPELEKVLNLSN